MYDKRIIHYENIIIIYIFTKYGWFNKACNKRIKKTSTLNHLT